MRTVTSFSRSAIGAAIIGVLSAPTVLAQGITASDQAASPSGDASSGRALVQSNKCMDCHRIGEEGSRLGPDLSDIGSRRSAILRHHSELEPNAATNVSR